TGILRWPGDVVNQTRPGCQRLWCNDCRTRRHHGPTGLAEFRSTRVFPPGPVFLHNVMRSLPKGTVIHSLPCCSVTAEKVTLDLLAWPPIMGQDERYVCVGRNIFTYHCRRTVHHTGRRASCRLRVDDPTHGQTIRQHGPEIREFP